MVIKIPHQNTWGLFVFLEMGSHSIAQTGPIVLAILIDQSYRKMDNEIQDNRRVSGLIDRFGGKPSTLKKM